MISATRSLSRLFKIILGILIFIFTNFAASQPVLSVASYTDKFASYSTLNNTLWLSSRLTETDFGSEGSYKYLKMTGIDQHTFKYLGSILIDDYPNSINFKFKYIAKSINQGAGIVISDVSQVIDSEPIFSNYLFFVWPKPDGNFYLFTPICPSSNPTCSPDIQLSNGVYKFESNVWHIINFSKNTISGSYSITSDGNSIFESVPTVRNIRSIYFGNPTSYTNTLSSWPEYYLSNVGINTIIDDQSVISFPYYSQIDPAWKDAEYDSGNTWNPYGEGTIGRWGCALSSAAMVLKKYNIPLPNGSEATPLALNNWLKNQPDGYIGGGLLNWLAITRLSHDTYTAGKSAEELEFVKSNNDISTKLGAGYYPILNTGKHFVVSYGESDTNYKINDPLTPLTTDYLKTALVQSVNTFVPSHSDLSYIMVVADPNIAVNLAGSTKYTESMQDELSPRLINKNIYMISKPPAGDYKLNISGTNGNPVTVYMYNKDGSVALNKVRLYANGTTQYLIRFDPNLTQNKVIINRAPILGYLHLLKIKKYPHREAFHDMYEKFENYFERKDRGYDTRSTLREMRAVVNNQKITKAEETSRQTILEYMTLLENN